MKCPNGHGLMGPVEGLWFCGRCGRKVPLDPTPADAAGVSPVC